MFIDYKKQLGFEDSNDEDKKKQKIKKIEFSQSIKKDKTE